MFEMFRAKMDLNGDNTPVMPGYQTAPSNPDQENLKYYHGVLAAGNGPDFSNLFGSFPPGVVVGIRPYRARNTFFNRY